MQEQINHAFMSPGHTLVQRSGAIGATAHVVNTGAISRKLHQ